MRKIFSIALILLMITGLFLIEPVYAYNTAVTDVNVIPQDYVLARPVRYEISFVSTHTLTGGRDTVTIKFPEEVTISSDIKRENVSVNDHTSGGIDYSDGVLTVLIPNSFNILAGETAKVAIASGVINNPKEAGNYSIKIYTSQDTQEAVSRSFYITDYEYSNGVSKPTVRVGLVSGDNAPEYTIKFKTSTNGQLVFGDYIYLTFPTGTIMPSSIERRDIKINGTELYYIPVIDGNKLSVRVPNSIISSGGSVEIVISSDADIKKPSNEYYNTIKVYTSVETQVVTSFAWELKSGSIQQSSGTNKGITVVPIPNGKGQAAAYTITISSGTLKPLGSSINNLIIGFPPSAALPDSIPADKVRINGTNAADCLIDKHTNSLVVILPSSYSPDAQLIITIEQSANIKNPGAAQYKFEVGIMRSSQTVFSDWCTIYETSTSTTNTSTTTTSTPTTPSATTGTTTSGTTTGRQQVELRVDSNLAYVDGVLQVLDASPTSINGVTMVPLRFVADYLGATTAYDTVTSSVTVKLGTKEIILWVDSAMAKVNGAFVNMNAETVNINNRLMIPVRFVSENLGAQVSWDGATRLITIVKGSGSTSPTTASSTAGSSATTAATSAYPINSKIYVKSENSYVNLRTGPDTNYELAGKLLQGESATIIQVDGNWYKIRLASGLEAWVANWVVYIK